MVGEPGYRPVTTLQGIVLQIVLLPRIFDWVLVPATLITLPLAFSRRTRSAALVAFFAIAAISLSLVMITTGSVVYASWRFGHVGFALLVNLGPSATFDLLASLLRVTGVRPIDFAPMIAATLGSIVAAVALSWIRHEAGSGGRSI